MPSLRDCNDGSTAPLRCSAFSVQCSMFPTSTATVDTHAINVSRKGGRKGKMEPGPKQRQLHGNNHTIEPVIPRRIRAYSRHSRKSGTLLPPLAPCKEFQICVHLRVSAVKKRPGKNKNYQTNPFWISSIPAQTKEILHKMPRSIARKTNPFNPFFVRLRTGRALDDQSNAPARSLRCSAFDVGCALWNRATFCETFNDRQRSISLFAAMRGTSMRSTNE